MKCPRCGYETEVKGNMMKHLTKKKPCHAILVDRDVSSIISEFNGLAVSKQHFCDLCPSSFTSLQACNRHKRHFCKARRQTENNISQEVQQLREHIARLERQITTHGVTNNTHGATNNTNCNNTTTNNTTHNNTIIINSYDKPNLEYLTPKFLTQCVKRRDKGLCELLQHIHYHPDHVENHNVRITNKKLNLIETHDGERFQYQEKNKVLDELVREGFEILENHYLENEEEVERALNYNETRLEEVRAFLEACRDQDIHVLTPLKQNVYLLVLNKQYIIFQKKQ